MIKKFKIDITELGLGKDNIILSDINLTLESGSSYLLVGRIGAGKSSLMNCILGFEDRFEGAITISENREIKKSFLPENFLVPDTVKGKDYLDSFIKILKDQNRFLASEFESFKIEFGIDSYWEKPLGSLSKGMKKAIFLCITLMAQSDMIVLDEPFEGFDPVLKEAISKKIQQRKEQGALVVVSSHEVESYVESFDVMVCIKKGMITDKISSPSRENYSNYLNLI